MSARGPTLGHVNIRTYLIEETVAFYEHLLGYERGPAATRPDPSKNIWLFDASGEPCIHVNVFRENEEPRTGDGSLHHISFNCPDRAAMAARLDAAGIPYEVMETRVPGLIQFNLRDPNDVRIELTFGHETVRRPPKAD